MSQRSSTHTGATEARIEYIADLMRSLKFRKGETVKMLAAEWGLEEQTVRLYSAEASRRVKAEVTDPDRVSSKVCTVLERVIDDAMSDGDRKSAIEAAKQWAVISGAAAPQKNIHRFDGMSEEELQTKAEQLAAKVLEKK